jgi:hypothetical protein
MEELRARAKVDSVCGVWIFECWCMLRVKLRVKQRQYFFFIVHYPLPPLREDNV